MASEQTIILPIELFRTCADLKNENPKFGWPASTTEEANDFMKENDLPEKDYEYMRRWFWQSMTNKEPGKMLNPYAASSISERQRTPSTIASPAYLARSDRTASRSPSKRPHSPPTLSQDLFTTAKRLKFQKNITDIDISQVDSSAVKEAVDEASASSALLHFESMIVTAAAALGEEAGYDCTEEDKSAGAVIKRLFLLKERFDAMEKDLGDEYLVALGKKDGMHAKVGAGNSARTRSLKFLQAHVDGKMAETQTLWAIGMEEDDDDTVMPQEQAQDASGATQ